MIKSIHIALFTVVFLTLSSCSKEDRDEENYGTAISFDLNVDQPDTRVTLFDKADCLTDPSNGGGNFRLSAYSNDSGQAVIDNARVCHMAWNGVLGWWFRNEMGTPYKEEDDELMNYYWPLGHTLDFFAYMPMKLDNTGVTINSYSKTEGPSISCKLPLDKSGQNGLQEFIYAYTEDRTQTMDEGNVPLQFKHPFACVIFRLGQSHRIKINEIQLTGIYNAGNYKPKTKEWDPSDSRETLSIEVGKTIPEQINYNSLIGGPYIVMPQSFNGTESISELILKYDYQSGTDLTGKIDIIGLSTKWEPGKIYTYTLNKGDSGEEVVFSVKVDEWDIIDYTNEIDVE